MEENQDLEPRIREKNDDNHEKEVDEVLRYDDTEEEIMMHNKKWMEFVRLKLNYGHQDATLVSAMHVKAGQYVKMFMLKKNLIVVANTPDGPCLMRILNRVSGRINAVKVGDPTLKSQFIEYVDIVNDPLVVQDVLRKLPPGVYMTGHERNFYCPRDFPKTLAFADMAVHQCIKIGSYFEMQLEESTQFVVVAKVLKNHRGLLLVSFGTTPTKSETRWVHMFSPFCHQFGWVGHQKNELSEDLGQKVTYVPGYRNEVLSDLLRNTVPAFVFRENVIQKHDFIAGDLLVVADSSMTLFYLAHVIPATLNGDYYFHLKVGHCLVTNSINDMACQFYANHPRIFSYEMAKKVGINVRIPEQLYLNEDENVLDTYRQFFVPNGRVRGMLLGPEITFQREILPMLSESKKDEIYEARHSLRFVEVLRRTSFGALQITAAEVVEFSYHLVRLKVSGVDSPVFMHMCDPNIFHVGSCIDMVLAVDFNPKRFDSKSRALSVIEWKKSPKYE